MVPMGGSTQWLQCEAAHSDSYKRCSGSNERRSGSNGRQLSVAPIRGNGSNVR